MSSKFEDDLIQQQDLYGAPPINVKENNVISGGVQVLYGVPSPGGSNPRDIIETPVLYGPPSPIPEINNGPIKAVAGGTGVILSMVIFIVGLIAMINRKVPTFVKVIIGICAIIIIVAIIALTVGIIHTL